MSERRLNPFDCDGEPVNSREKVEASVNVLLILGSFGTSMVGVVSDNYNVERFGVAWMSTQYIWNYAPTYLRRLKDRFTPKG